MSQTNWQYGQQTPEPQPPKKRRLGSAGKVIIYVAITLLVITLAALVMNYLGILRFPWEPVPTTVSGSVASLKQGSPNMSDDDLRAALQEIADTKKISLAFNGKPKFPSGDEEGNIYIINPATSYYHMEYRIYLKDEKTGELKDLLYQTPIMPPNTYIDKDKLSIILPKGVYAASAEVYAYDPDDLETSVSFNTIGLKITIEN